MEKVKEYLNEIKVPFEEEQTKEMTVLRLKYREDLVAIFPPEDDTGEYEAAIVYDGKLQQYTKMGLEELKEWLHAVFIKHSPNYIYKDKPKQMSQQND